MNFQIQSAVTSSYLTSAPIEDLSQVATTPFPVLTNSFTHFHFLSTFTFYFPNLTHFPHTYSLYF